MLSESKFMCKNICDSIIINIQMSVFVFKIILKLNLNDFYHKSADKVK